MKNRIFIDVSIWVLLACIIGCGQQCRKSILQVPLVVAIDTSERAYLCGEWGGSHDMFYGGTLTLNKDGTFAYAGRGCVNGVYTEGKWASAGTKIVLTSFDKYLPPKEPLATHDNASGSVDGDTALIDNDSVVDTVGIGNNTIGDTTLQNSLIVLDTAWINRHWSVSIDSLIEDTRHQPVYFQHVVLELRRDTLFAVDSPLDGIRYFTR